MKRLALVSLLALVSAEAAAQSQIQAEPAGLGAAEGGGVTPGGITAATPLPFHDAPAATLIVPDTDPTRSLDTQVSQAGNVYTIDGGRTAGTNLFHSFADFDLAGGDIARWQFSAGDPTTLTNVINRVTGGNPSLLFGTIDSSAIPNADFWFINPAGIVFGAGAVIDVPAAAYFSTASELRFASGPAFAVAAPDGSTLSVANPVAFGFLGGEGAIFLEDLDSSFVQNGGALNLTASDIVMTDSLNIVVGSFTAAATGGAAVAVGLDGSASAPLAGEFFVSNSFIQTESSATASGDISVNAGTLTMVGDSALLTVAGTGFDGGSITIAADQLTLLDSGFATVTLGTDAAGDIFVQASDITLDESIIQSTSTGAGAIGTVSVAASGLLAMSNVSTIAADAFGDADSGGVFVQAGDLSMTGASYISSDALAQGNAGGVQVEVANLLTMDGLSYISSDSFGSGNGGSVGVTAGAAQLSGESFISSDALGDGDGGGVSLDAGSLTLENFSSISSGSFGAGNGGGVTVNVDGLLALDFGSSISADARLGSGNGGTVLVNAGTAQLTGASSISSDALSDGNGGGVIVNVAGLLSLDQFSYISSDTVGLGNGGSVEVTAGAAELTGASYISSDALDEGQGGNVSVEVAGDLLLIDSYVSSDSLGSGTAGVVSVTAGYLGMAGGYISSDALGSGAAGNVFVQAGEADLIAGSRISSDIEASGVAGSVEVDVLGRLTLDDESSIRSNVGSEFNRFASGPAGDVLVTAGEIVLAGRSFIASDVWGDGSGGSVAVGTDQLTMIQGSYISSDALNVGNAGDVFVLADNADVSDGSYISSDVYGEGDGGSVEVQVSNTLRISNGGAIRSDVRPGAFGSGGGVFVTVGTLIMSDTGVISSDAFGFGDAGLVSVEANSLQMSRGSYISSDSLFFGDGGDVSVIANQASLTDGSYISSDALGEGDAGLVTIQLAGELRLRGGSYISSDVQGSGNAGSLFVTADRIDMAEASYITSNTLFNSTGNAGDVLVETPTLIMASNSYIASDASGDGNAGFVDVLASNLLTMTGGAFISSSTFGQGDAGIVSVRGGEGTITDSSIQANAFASGNAQAIFIDMASLRLVRSQIVSEASGTGQSGFIEITANELEIVEGSTVSTRSLNPLPAGLIFIDADRLLVDGVGSAISSANESAAGGDAGEILIVTDNATISEGGRITTNSVAGRAGNIEFQMPDDGLLILEGRDAPGTIETSSGPGTGGQIIIASPLAIISNGGNILALGESGGANVLIDTQYFIASADRLNRVEVDGVLEFSNAIYDVSAGIVNPDLSVLDASGVLRGQCPAERATGQVSELIVRESGPYGTRPADPPPEPSSEPSPGPTTALSTIATGECL